MQSDVNAFMLSSNPSNESSELDLSWINAHAGLRELIQGDEHLVEDAFVSLLFQGVNISDPLCCSLIVEQRGTLRAAL